MEIKGLDGMGGPLLPGGSAGVQDGGGAGIAGGMPGISGNGRVGIGEPGAGLEELQKLETLGRAMAGQKFLEAVARKNSEALLSMGAGQEEQEEQTGAESAGESRTDRSADEASLSPDSRAAVLKEEAAVLLRKQLEAGVSQKLQQLKDWEPSGNQTLAGDLEQLRELYRGLVSEILKLPDNMQDLQAQRLNLVLAEALQKLGAGKYPNLNGLFLEAGEKQLANLLLASAFRLVTGKTAPPEAFGAALRADGGAHSVYGRGQDGGSPASGAGLSAQGASGSPAAAAPDRSPGLHVRGRETAEASFAQGQDRGGFGDPVSQLQSGGRSYQEAYAANAEAPEAGVLYNQSGRRSVSADAGYQEQVRLAERFSPHTAGEPVLAETSGRHGKGKLYTAVEIERAESFCRYFRQGGNLLDSPQLTARNEELLGFLMAQNMMKGELFSQYGGAGREMGRNIRDILEKLSRYYLGRAEEDCLREEGGASYGRLDKKAVQRIYYQVLQFFHRMKKPQKALEEGLKRAAEEFCAKQEKTENQKKKRYQEDAGFFEKTLFRKSRRKQWEEAERELEKDWGDFLKSLGQQGNEFLQLAFSRYSPWGSQLEAEGAQQAAKNLHPLIPVLVSAAVLLLLLLFVMR